MTNTNSGALPRAITARVVDAVLKKGRNLDAAFAEAEVDKLEPRDQAFVRALSYGTLRNHYRNRKLIALLVARPIRNRDSVITALLSVGLFALIESKRPDYAVVSATVGAVTQLERVSMRGLVNAVLRRFLREREGLLAAVSKDKEAGYQHPQWLIEKLQVDWPRDWEDIIAAGNKQAPMWVRINTKQHEPALWLDRLQHTGVAATTPVSTMPGAVLLDAPLMVQELPGFSLGDCSVQDLASQLAAHFLQAGPGMRVLDACAAPGGKATHVLELCPDIKELVAVDKSEQRLSRVQENLERLGFDNKDQVTLIEGDALDPEKWWKESRDKAGFDRILVDAPCSATGVIRRHPDIRFLRRTGDISSLVETQLQMLEKLWPLLKPGGWLLYSTCSVLRAENEAVIAEFLARRSDAYERQLPVKMPEEARGQTEHGLQLLPGQADNDGFYYALLERLPV
ncbi:MAG: 16S rRNA (cytosine(967)-C(5))-methyltransferase RsmB [Gammaproteobacteria bacterium]|nr:16S rRNA (cytosine(967)-C(5))-methyltransferase RsmB [Gammaproteobacteria bacterium]MCP4091748.1 16S rRNA (cytosine(967)-C(5))-methyltransferase RsmB [Gammaproteobacteria bacterium]MCP4275055.1 16S rRNA (cytosine(967)-C(5))-methyltransferase RsmB [Gammaproteobacteria bacterium]MCP4831879.1 16S rRNA (cytosine(967)-C(5))-methyltransferase RsmB [Gammaproteobacteria bacterium]MCP4929814.1 16S rRNA (cytosine(967)-C(5))-methyltransferase RsmB [Gammaproteobacteria bacterium]